jgi:hypothetical protein
MTTKATSNIDKVPHSYANPYLADVLLGLVLLASFVSALAQDWPHRVASRV